MTFHDQSLFDVRFDWGLRGLDAISVDATVVIVDVLSFSTCVSIACGRGATVYPSVWNEERARELALEVGAEVTTRRSGVGRSPQESRFSLSPTSLLHAHADLRLVLPSPNGSALADKARAEGRSVVAGCLRNAAAVANWLSGQGKPVAIIAAGERWKDDTIRFAVEDLVGAGAIINRIAGARSPEASSAVATFQSCRSNLESTLVHSGSGRELEQRGFAGDVALAAELDADSCVPQLIDRAFRAA